LLAIIITSIQTGPREQTPAEGRNIGIAYPTAMEARSLSYYGW